MLFFNFFLFLGCDRLCGCDLALGQSVRIIFNVFSINVIFTGGFSSRILQIFHERIPEMVNYKV